MAARNGTSSTESSRLQGPAMTGSAMWESVPVSPCPGKCFAVASMPWSWSPWMAATTSRPTAYGSSPNERVLMIGLAGLLLMSATGRKGEVNADGPAFERGDPADLVGIQVAAGRQPRPYWWGRAWRR